MEEAEKMAALKKAYADIILNTAKEAAGRIMVSERKALRFQQELFASKEESLNMLLRLKQMTDSKLVEAELTSLSKQKKIEDLETQLRGAEDTVKDLRTELKRVHDELGKVKNNLMHATDEETLKRNIDSRNKLNTSDTVLSRPLNLEPETGSISDVKNGPLNSRNTDEKCCVVLENATEQTEPSSNSRTKNNRSVNPNLASIIMGSKEPELYRNGCTQRIRAFERNLLNGDLPLSEHADDHFSHLKDESIIKEGEKDEGTCALSLPEAENEGMMEENPIDIQKIMKYDNKVEKDEAVIRRFPSRRRRSRYGKTKSNPCRSLPNKVLKICKPSILPCSRSHQNPVNGNVKSSEDPRTTVKDEPVKGSDSHLGPPSPLNTINVGPQSGFSDGIGDDAEVTKAGSVQNIVNEGVKLIDDTLLPRLEEEATENSGVPVGNFNQGTVDVGLTNSEPKDEKKCEVTIGDPTPAVNDGILKYTFRRKRKKGSLSSSVEVPSLENNTSKRNKPSDAPEPQKPSLIIESSRDSRRLAQVARQLISLSEKRWW